MAADSVSSVDAWSAAWLDALHFHGDPFARLAKANETDSGFALGSVFCGTYRVLGGSRLDAPEVRADLARATERAATTRELDHVEALGELVAGDFTKAGERWDAIAARSADLAAIRFAHDVYLHVGDAERRLRSSTQAYESWSPSHPGWGFVTSQYAFALEEAGHFDEAEKAGWAALEADPLDLWALHALAHVYESIGNDEAALDLMRSRAPIWTQQDSLSVHIWWHLALRLIADRSFDEVLAIHDRTVPLATTPFRLCDLTSMLWRLELVGVDVGDRWNHLADAFAARPETHTNGFIDLHAALVFSRRPGHPAAARFFDGVLDEHDGRSENDLNFRTVVAPLVTAIRAGSAEPQRSAQVLEALSGSTHRIGGSVAQRDLLDLTRHAWEAS